MGEVDQFLDRVAAVLRQASPPPAAVGTWSTLTVEEVEQKRFTPVRLREGYDMGEVDQFLDRVAAHLRRHGAGTA